MDPKRTDLLSPRERECLRLVSRGFSSKEIAKHLGISYHTVDDHLKKSIAALGVSSRFEAARILADDEAGIAPPPQHLGTQAPAIDPPADRAPDGASDEGRIKPWWARLPFLRNGRQSNELSPGQRVAWILAGSVGILFGLSQLANVLFIVQSIAHGRVH